MTIIRTNLGETRERARQIRFDQSTLIPRTDVQSAIEQVENEILAVLAPITIVVVSGSGTIAATAVLVQTTQAAPITLTLPSSVTWLATSGRYVSLQIWDASGTVSVGNTVTINAAGGQTIDGLASVTINNDYGGYLFLPKTGGGWIVR